MMPPARCTSSMCTSAIDGRDLAQHGHAARQPVDVGHGEVDLGLVRGGQQMQHGVGRAAHGDVERHGVLERLEAGDRARQHASRRPARSSGGRDRRSRWPASTNSRLRSAWVASVEPLPGSDRPSASVRQFIELAVNMPEHEPQVGQAERSITCDVGVADLVVGGGDHRVDQVDRPDVLPLEHDLAGLHRPAGDEDRGDVEPQRRHQHAGRDLVAVGDADQRVGAMGVDHVFDAVGDQLARGQAE